MLKHIENYRLGILSLKEAVEKEFETWHHHDLWLKDVFGQVLSKDEYSEAYKHLNFLVRERSFNKIFK